MLSNSLLFNKGLFTQKIEAPSFVIHQKPSPKSRNGRKHTKSVSIDFQNKQLFNRTSVVKMVKRKGPDLILNIRQLDVGKEKATTPMSFLNLKPIQENKMEKPKNNILQYDNYQFFHHNLTIFDAPCNATYINSNPNVEVRKGSISSLNEITGVEGIKVKENITRKERLSTATGRKLKTIILANKPLIHNETTLQDLKIPSLTSGFLLGEKDKGFSKDPMSSHSSSESLQNILENSNTSIVEHLIEDSHEKEKTPKKPLNLVMSSLDEQKLEARLKRTLEASESKEFQSYNQISCRTEPNEKYLTEKKENYLSEKSQSTKNIPDTNSNNFPANSLHGWVFMKAKKHVSEKLNRPNIGFQTLASQRSPKGSGSKNNVTIKSYTNNKLKSVRKIQYEDFDSKIVKTCKKIRTIEENILSPLNYSGSSEEDTFMEYVEKIKSKGSLRSL